MTDSAPGSTEERGGNGLLFLVVVVLLEIGILYLLIAVESPLSPLVQPLLTNGIGIFGLVMAVVVLLGFTVSVVLRLVEGRRGVNADSQVPR